MPQALGMLFGGTTGGKIIFRIAGRCQIVGFRPIPIVKDLGAGIRYVFLRILS